MAIDVTISGLNTVVDVVPSQSSVINATSAISDFISGQTIDIDDRDSPARNSTVSGLNTVVDVTMGNGSGGGGGGGAIDDVTVNGTSVVNNRVAEIQATLVQIVRW